MKGRVAAKTAQERKQEIEEKQITITEKNMERFAGQTLDVLIEEQIEGNKESGSFWLGRLYCQAPEIDGAAVLAESGTSGKISQTGNLVPCKVIARRGFDLEVMVV
jgi:tRNA A37 methylthiotransferase MiaB